MFGIFKKPTSESLLASMIKTAAVELDAAQRQLILASDNLYTSEAAVAYSKDRLARLQSQMPAADGVSAQVADSAV